MLRSRYHNPFAGNSKSSLKSEGSALNPLNIHNKSVFDLKALSNAQTGGVTINSDND